MPQVDKNNQVVHCLHDWPERLYAFVEARQSTPFDWGSNDCCSFAADAVLQCTGVDPLADIRPDGVATWATQLQAYKLLKAHGGMAAMVTARLGQPVPVLMAQRGDVLLVQMDGLDALVVCLGAQYVGAGPAGVVYGPINDALLAWRV